MADPRKRSPEPERRLKQKPKRFFDLHLRQGIEDHLVRLSARDYEKLLTCWILNEETVVLRSVYENKETNIILRGSQGGFVSIQSAAAERKVATYNVVRTADWRREFLERRGHPEPGSTDGAASEEG